MISHFSTIKSFLFNFGRRFRLFIYFDSIYFYFFFPPTTFIFLFHLCLYLSDLAFLYVHAFPYYRFIHYLNAYLYGHVNLNSHVYHYYLSLKPFPCFHAFLCCYSFYRHLVIHSFLCVRVNLYFLVFLCSHVCAFSHYYLHFFSSIIILSILFLTILFMNLFTISIYFTINPLKYLKFTIFSNRYLYELY